MSFDFDATLQQYAEVLVRVGANVQPGKKIVLNVPVTTDPIIRRLVHAFIASAYDAGASHVITDWADQYETRLRLEHAADDTLEVVDTWAAQRLEDIVRDGGSLLALRAVDPDLLEGQDPDKVATLRAAGAKARKPTRKLWNQGIGTWSLAAGSIQPWADKVLPDVPQEERVVKLWELIFRASRILVDDPVAEWQRHSQALMKRAQYLTQKQYHALHYTAPGTDLTVGLADNHVWLGGGDTTQDGRHYMPNIPTEEVFTMPHRLRVNGTVTSTKPLIYSSTMIDDFSLTFQEGKVVDLKAGKGEATLRKMIETDEGAARLGEVALVPNSSPISQMNVLFYNTLFDENASCHLALGAAYHNTMKDGPFMSEEDYEAAGGNSSLVHTDFMMGSAEMNIDGIRADGSREPVMRQGEWAFDA